MSDRHTLFGVESRARTSAHVQLARIVTHELRNPLMVIGSMVRRIVRMNPEAAKGETYSALMSSVSRMETLLKDMDAFISTPLPILKQERIADLMRAEFDESARRRQEKTISPVLSTGDPDITAPVDAQLLRKAVSMIIKESAASLPEGSNLPVAVYGKGTFIEILFGDADHCGSFCDLYDPRLESKTWSTSLYLSTAHRIFTDHGGKMLFDTESRTVLPVLVRISRQKSLK